MSWQQYLTGEYISFATASFWNDKAPVLYFNVVDKIYESYMIEAVIVLNGPIYNSDLGETICIGLGTSDEAVRTFVGIMTKMRYEGSTQRKSAASNDEEEDSSSSIFSSNSQNLQYIYRIWLESPLAKLRYETKYYIEQNETRRAIITDRLNNALIDTTPVLIDDDLPMPTNTQYGETTYDYVIRLMQEAGVIGYFSQPIGMSVYSLNLPSYNLVENLDTATRLKLDFQEVRIGRYEFEQLLEFTLESDSSSQSCSVSDYNFATPKTPIIGEAEDTTGWTGVKKEIYPGRELTTEGATEKATQLLGNKTSRLSKFQAYTTSYKVSCGQILTLSGNVGAINGDYVVEESVHTLKRTEEGWEYSNIISGVAYSTDYQAPMNRVKPKVYGNQTAIVVGTAENADINVDEFGRVKVKFVWSNNNSMSAATNPYIDVSNPSSWARLMQWGAAGKGWGNVSLPRVGQEVMVGFLNGDPDYPIVFGGVYNGDNQPAYSLPTNNNQTVIRTQTTGLAGESGLRYNELRMVDTPLDELVSLRAQHNAEFTIMNDYTTQVVGGNMTTTILDGKQTTINTGGSRYAFFGSLLTQSASTVSATASAMRVLGEIPMLAPVLAAAGAAVAAADAAAAGLVLSLPADMNIMETGLNLTHIVAGAYGVSVDLGGIDFSVTKGIFSVSATISNMSVLGYARTSVTGRNSLDVGGNNNVTVGGDFNIDVAGMYSQTVEGVHKINVTGESTTTVEGILNLTSLAALNLKAGAELSIEAAGELSITAGNISITGEAIEITAGAEMSLEAAAAFEITAAGVVEVTGTMVSLA